MSNNIQKYLEYCSNSNTTLLNVMNKLKKLEEDIDEDIMVINNQKSDNIYKKKSTNAISNKLRECINSIIILEKKST